MILKKYIKKFQADLGALGLKQADFLFRTEKMGDVIKSAVIQFRDTPFEFVIETNEITSSKSYGEFRYKYVTFTPDFKIKDGGRYLYPGSIQTALRYWILEEINTYLEENELEPITLVPEKLVPSRKNAIPKIKAFAMNTGPGININLSKPLFWTVTSVLFGATFWLGFHLGQAKFDKEKLDYYNTNQQLRKELEYRNGIINFPKAKKDSSKNFSKY